MILFQFFYNIGKSSCSHVIDPESIEFLTQSPYPLHQLQKYSRVGGPAGISRDSRTVDGQFLQIVKSFGQRVIVVKEGRIISDEKRTVPVDRNVRLEDKMYQPGADDASGRPEVPAHV